MAITEQPRMLDVDVGATRVSVALALHGRALASTLDLEGSGDVATLLSPAEKRRFESFEFEKRRNDWLSGRLISKTLLTHHLGGSSPSPRRLEILSDEDHKPVAGVLDGEGRRAELDLCLSLSHRGGAAGAAIVSRGSVGIDIEIMEPRSEALLDDYFTPREGHLVDQLDEPSSRWGIGLFWSIKEAALKVVGVGLSVPASDAEIVGIDERDMSGLIALRGDALRTSRIEFEPSCNEILAPFSCLLEPPFIVSLACLP